MLRNSDSARGLTLISPPLLYAVLMLAGPLGMILMFSFVPQSDGPNTLITLQNYTEALGDPLYRQLIIRSLLISAAATAITVLLAFPIAYFISFYVPPKRKSLWLFLITIPFWTSYLIRIFLWKVILGLNGLLNTGLLKLGLINEPLEFILYNPAAVVITLAHAFAPFAILPIFVALEKIDRSLLEASQDLGESKVRTFFRVTLPLAVPGVVASVLIVFIPTVGDYVTPRLVGGSEGTMIANMIQVQFLRLDNRPMGATLSVITMICVTIISLLFVLANRRNMKART
ncbi:ABC transporter permease [Parasulfitobacter algicola]|uniref:ABC transporter permease n=1 Tax=Parasulfitobacter algicola TaxID=2614809 RepID=A0ABX2IQN6_9RHOB|nr:ABC transporter permease [Sulfitobacter algicola]NSX55201.1 ABC transporter permease [Sulfitobacter algicola]